MLRKEKECSRYVRISWLVLSESCLVLTVNMQVLTSLAVALGRR